MSYSAELTKTQLLQKEQNTVLKLVFPSGKIINKHFVAIKPTMKACDNI